VFSVIKRGTFVLYNVDEKTARDYVIRNGGQLYYKDLEKQKIHKAGWWFKKED
jgi:hypothetical protein